MQSTSLRFAESVRVLSNAARSCGLEVPAIRSRPRRTDVDRTIRRRPDGEAIVAVRLEGRPFAAVQADLVESFVVANGLVDADAARLRRDLWRALEAGGALGVDETGERRTAGDLGGRRDRAGLVAVAAA